MTGISWACSRCVSNSNTTNNETNNETTNPFADSDDDTDDEDDSTCVHGRNISTTCRGENCNNSRNFHSTTEAYNYGWDRNENREWVCPDCSFRPTPNTQSNHYDDDDDY